MNSCLNYYYGVYKPRKKSLENQPACNMKRPLQANNSNAISINNKKVKDTKLFPHRLEGGQKSLHKNATKQHFLHPKQPLALTSSEKDLAWLGEESRRISNRKAFDWDFIEKYSAKVARDLYDVIQRRKLNPSFQKNPLPLMLRYSNLTVRKLFADYRDMVRRELLQGKFREDWKGAFEYRS